jgi:hypothetical protein
MQYKQQTVLPYPATLQYMTLDLPSTYLATTLYWGSLQWQTPPHQPQSPDHQSAANTLAKPHPYFPHEKRHQGPQVLLRFFLLLLLLLLPLLVFPLLQLLVLLLPLVLVNLPLLLLLLLLILPLLLLLLLLL